MSRRPLLTLVAFIVIASCGNETTPVAQTTGLQKLLPDVSAAAPWSIAEGPTLYTPETLFEYENGGAERFLGHGFRELVHARYQLGDDPFASITLDLYDMGSELGAFGIYTAGRTPPVDARLWGAEGYRVGAVAAAWRGSLFVHGESDDERPELVETLERMMVEVGERAPGSRAPPAVVEPLPEEGRVAHSERYVPADLLGLAFLPGGVLASYEFEGKQSELYFSDLGSESAAAGAFEELRVHVSRWGSVEDEPPPLGDQAFRYSDPTLGAGTAARSGSFIVGIHGDMSAADRDSVLAALVTKLH